MVETSYNVIYLPLSVFATCGTVTPDCRNTLHVFERLISYYRLKKYQGNTVNFQEEIPQQNLGKILNFQEFTVSSFFPIRLPLSTGRPHYVFVVNNC